MGQMADGRWQMAKTCKTANVFVKSKLIQPNKTCRLSGYLRANPGKKGIFEIWSCCGWSATQPRSAKAGENCRVKQ
jgi:hypothetical protein